MTPTKEDRMSTVDLTHVAREAVEWLNTHEWVQGTWGDDTKGCLHQAVRVCDPQPGDGFVVSAVLTARGHDADWNDAEGRTKAEVLGVLAALSVTDTELEATFGPMWRQMVFLVRKCAALTAEQGEQLASAWAWARTSARGAELGAALGAARGAEWGAARDAVRSAAWGAARGEQLASAWAWARTSARDAALATVTRDLITTDQYNTLTGPWVSVMGPIEDAS
jgi:hypothetical protein